MFIELTHYLKLSSEGAKYFARKRARKTDKGESWVL
jgi:hypothetical protein